LTKNIEKCFYVLKLNPKNPYFKHTHMKLPIFSAKNFKKDEKPNILNPNSKLDDDLEIKPNHFSDQNISDNLNTSDIFESEEITKPDKTNKIDESENENNQEKLLDFPTDFGKKNHSDTFFGLNLDILWAGIAIGCLLGLAMFWFQGFSPSMLSGFTHNTIENLDQIEKKNTGQINAIIQSYNLISEKSLYNNLNICNLDQKYISKNDDITFLDGKEIALLPASNLQKVPSMNGFYLQTYRDLQKPLYSQYSAYNLDNKTLVQDAKSYPFYLEYRNTWIESCVNIRNSQGNAAQIKNTCLDLQTKTDAYNTNQELKKPEIWKEALPIIQKGVETCNQYSTQQNFGRWQLQWLSQYDLLMSIQPNFSVKSEELKQQAEKFSQETSLVKDKVLQDYNQKKSTMGSVYLLNFEY